MGSRSIRTALQNKAHALRAFLGTQDYTRAAQILNEARGNDRTGDASSAHLFEAAHRMCLAARQCQIDAHRHEHARDGSRRRERELRLELDSILNLIGGEFRDDQETPSVAVDLHGGPNLWRRLRARWRPAVQRRTRTASPGALLVARRGEGGLGGVEESPSLAAYCLGPFRTHVNDRPVEDWANCRGKSVFKYLLAHRERPVHKEILMELFWPRANPRAARNNLNVAIYSVRQMLGKLDGSFPHVLFQDDCYLINPDMRVWVDCEAFRVHVTAGLALERQREPDAAVGEYRAAEVLYQGDFLEEDRYEEWVVPLRQSLREDYLAVLDRLGDHYHAQKDYYACSTIYSKLLATDACHEAAHRRLMVCYSRQGRRHLALRQYHLCVQGLAKEFEAEPAESTTALYEAIRHRKAV